jgi:hypothetical protein
MYRQLRLVSVQGWVAAALILTSDVRRHRAAPNPEPSRDLLDR